MKVEVYFNLHKKLFSVRQCSTGRVILHTRAVHLLNPVFVVRKQVVNVYCVNVRRMFMPLFVAKLHTLTTLILTYWTLTSLGITHIVQQRLLVHMIHYLYVQPNVQS